MKKILTIILFNIIFITSVGAHSYIDDTFEGKKIKIFEYDLNDFGYNMKIAINTDYNATSLKTLMENYNGVSAVNGVFFCPKDYRECRGEDFTKNERYLYGYKYAKEDSTGDRVVFALDKENKPFLFQTDLINPDREDEIYSGFANYPLLLWNGEEQVSNYAEKGLLDSKMKVNGTRNFICSNEKKDKIFTGLVYNISLPDLPEYLLKLGCFDALNLDAGATTSLIYNGNQIVGPGRNLLDGVIFEKKGLDVAKVVSASKKARTKLEEILEDKDIEQKLKIVSDMTTKLRNLKQKMYETNSIDLYSDEKNEEKITGYKAEIKSLNDVRIMFFINYFVVELSNLKKELEKEQRYIEDSQNLLF